MKYLYFSIVFFLCLFITACSNDSTKKIDNGESAAATAAANIDNKGSVTKTEIDLSPFFGDLLGSAIFLDESGNYLIYNQDEINLRFSPCSTFKIVSTLAAFEFNVVIPSQSVIEWDGTEWPFDSWNRDLTITEAFQSSCVWYYRKLTDQIGKENMTNFIETIDYGNCDISQWDGSGFNENSPVDGFWLESSLLISPQEQVDLMYRIFEGKTDIDENNISEVKKMMYKENNDSTTKVYGKTGSGKGGWFVGFFELDGNITYFAVHLSEQENVNGPMAQGITNNIINGYFLKQHDR